MPVVRNKFQDPSGSLPEFQWSANHSEEEVTEKRRNVTYSSNTSDTGLVRQQGDETPLRFSYSGKITTEADLIKFLEYWKACRERTVRFTDFAGDSYEVLITSFAPTRQRVLRNPRDTTNAPFHIWSYKIEMEAVTILSGPYYDAGVSP